MVSIDREKNEASDIFVLKECYECEKQPIKKNNQTLLMLLQDECFLVKKSINWFYLSLFNIY